MVPHSPKNFGNHSPCSINWKTKKFWEQPSTNSSKANARAEIPQVLFWDALLTSETQDTQAFMHFKGGPWLNLGKVCELKEREKALGRSAAVVLLVQMGVGAQLLLGGINALWKADSTDVLQLSLWLILTSCLHSYKRQICWHFYFQPPGLDKHFLQIAHMSWGWAWGGVQGRQEFKSWGWRQGLEVVMARMSHQAVQVNITNCGQQAEGKQCSKEEVKYL